jgi:hypothetical protein
MNLEDLVADKMVEDKNFLERVSEKVVSLFSDKAVWTTATINNLPDSAFLHILPGGKKDSEGKTTPRDLRMFPYKGPDGSIDLPHLRNAIARIPQSNRIDQATKDRLQARARKLLGGQKDSSVGFFKDAAGQWYFLGIYSNKFEDRDEEILSEKSHQEYISWLKESEFKPVITTLHQPKMPAIFWPVVFDKLENSPSKLSEVVRKIYKNFAFAEAERVMYVNGFTVVSAKVFEDKVNIAEALSKESDLGMSHGFIVKEFSDNIVDKYRTFEMSVLKRKRAANFITLSLFAAKDKLGMSNEKGLGAEDRQFLTSVYGEDVANSLEQGTKNIEEMLREAGLSFKDFEEEKPVEEDKTKNSVKAEEEVATKEEEIVEETKEEVASDVVVVTPELVTEIAKALNLDALQEVLKGFAEAVKGLQDTVEAQNKEINSLKSTTKELEKSDDEKIAAQITPSFNWALLGVSQSKSAENQVTKEEKDDLEKAAPVGSDGDHKGDAFHEFFAKSITNGSRK